MNSAGGSTLPGLFGIGLGLRVAATPSSTVAFSRPFLSTVGRTALVGGVTLAGQQRGYTSTPEGGAHEVGRLVSSATEKIGLGDNQFAAGGFQLALLGGILAGLRVLGSHALEYLKKRVVVTAEFDSRDESYSWILNWLSDHPYSRDATNFSVSTTIARGAQKLSGEGVGSVQAPYFLPAPGFHFFWYKNRLLWMYRERARPAGATVATAGSPVENITISTLGRSRSILQTLILEAQHKFIERDQSRTVIFAADQYGAWRRTKSRPKRPLETIVMDPELKSYIVEDAKEFFSSESWYAERGLPFRRGILLYGSPGTGKTSFIHALAGELGLNIYVINLSNKAISDSTLSELVADTPSRCLLLIEDVDAAFVQRDSNDASSGITFSGLLNSVDGVSAQEGRILCMTTNHLERLDEALIRPGRVDVRAKFGKATQSQAKELFTKFFPQSVSVSTAHSSAESSKSIDISADKRESDGIEKHVCTQYTPSITRQEAEELAARFAEQIPDQEFSIAQLQGFLMGYKKHPDFAVKNVKEFVRQAGSMEVSGTAKIGYSMDQDINDEEQVWQGNEELQKAQQEFREEKEKARRDSIKQ
ncbi:hypothetical protein BGW38_006941 [Lunasporangiospora selenospora]|uniref:Uncharacterized protein n=1 Tax=Lunasporangiospora selenospora TaxID=979761 RepID=A0A9P6G3E8_9FUNG|nr:hypothetical protein BGW38_006941 [Lunasporangiospora selenospora]